MGVRSLAVCLYVWLIGGFLESTRLISGFIRDSHWLPTQRRAQLKPLSLMSNYLMGVVPTCLIYLPLSSLLYTRRRFRALLNRAALYKYSIASQMYVCGLINEAHFKVTLKSALSMVVQGI